MFHRRIIHTLVLLLLCVSVGQATSTPIEIKKDKIYVNDELFLIKGIGYSSYHPYEAPPKSFVNLSRRRKEFEVIREAGFNTIRTWQPLTLEELELAYEYGLMVIQGVWIEYRQNFTDPANIKKILNFVTPYFKESSEAPNVLLFLLGNEPQPSQVFSVGRKNTDDFFIQLKDTITQSAPDMNVSISNWVQADFLNDTMWDMAALNIYPYNPQTVSHATGFRGYVEWMKEARAVDRPFVITEMGLSVSKGGQGKLGYGGNSLDDQKSGVLQMYHDSFSGGANGACVFEFIDEWWKNNNHGNDFKIHEENDAEEWFGISWYDEDGYLHKRPVFHALKEYNQAIVYLPKDKAVIKKSSPLEVYVEETITSVSYRIGTEEKWIKLSRKSPHWFKGKINTKRLKPGMHNLEIQAIGPDPDKPEESKEYLKTQEIIVDNKGALETPYSVEILLDQEIYYTQNRIRPIRTRFKVTDAKGKPVPDTEVTIAVYEPVLYQKLQFIKKTDEEGLATHVYHVNEEGIVTVAAGVLTDPEGKKLLSEENSAMFYKNGDVKHIQVYYQDLEKDSKASAHTEETQTKAPEKKSMPLVKTAGTVEATTKGPADSSSAPVSADSEVTTTKGDTKDSSSPLPEPKTPEISPAAPEIWPGILTEEGGNLILGDEPFLIKGICYSPTLPADEHPGEIDLNRMAREFKLIRKAGFNTLRTYTPLPESALRIARENDLHIIQGMTSSYGQDFSDPESAKPLFTVLNNQVQEERDESNVLFYLAGEQPSPDAIFSATPDVALNWDNLFEQSTRELSVKAPVTIADWPPSDFFKGGFNQLGAINLFNFRPGTVADALGYTGYLNWFKRTQFPKRPLIVTETGLSIGRTGEGYMNAGGNTLWEQRQGLLELYQGAFWAGAQGACVYEFIDGWWRGNDLKGDALHHESMDNQEWYGIAYYDGNSCLSTRPAFDALADINQALVITPGDKSVLRNKIPVRVYVEDTIRQVKARLGGCSDWIDLERVSPHWFEGSLSTRKVSDGHQIFEVKAWGADPDEVDNLNKEKIYSRRHQVYIDNKNKIINTPHIEIQTDKDLIYTRGEETSVTVTVLVTDEKNKPLKNTPVTLVIYSPNQETEELIQASTDKKGHLEKTIPIEGTGILALGAAVAIWPDDQDALADKKNHSLFNKYGNIKHIQVYYDESQPHKA